MFFVRISSIVLIVNVLLACAVSASAQDNDPSLSANPVRPVYEFLGGTGLGFLGGIIGGSIGAASYSRSDDEDDDGMGSFYGAVKGAYLGVLTAFPIGVYTVGEFTSGNGNFWVTAAVPWAFALSISISYAAVGVIDSPAFYLGGGAIALLSSIVLYEISSELALPNDDSPEVKVSLFGDHTSAGITLLGKL